MSGNPFRASLVQNHPTAAPPTSFNVDNVRTAEAQDEREGDAVLDAPSATPAKTKKSVRIESPSETSPPHPAFRDARDSSLHSTNRTHHGGLPSPMSPTGFSDNFSDLDVDETQRRNELGSLGMTGSARKSSEATEALGSPSGAPANPFSKTLATIEPQEKGSGELVGHNRDRTTPERAAHGTTKASLDVEGFKNMLMTGISSPRRSGPPPLQAAVAPNPIGASVFESSSSTDTSSVSRQSIFEPVQEPHPESSRTSYEMAGSDDDRASLMSDMKKEKKKPPPAPKHRHGKLVSSRTPQIVSFSDFSAAEPTASPSRPRTDSDLNKPLPPTPAVISPPSHIVSQDITQEPPSISDTRSIETASISDTASTTKKVPPPVPLARRQSQLRSSTVGNRSRSNSSLTMSSQHSTEMPLLSPGMQEPPTSSPSQKAPPPPPPTRRHGAALSTISTSSANSSSTELSSTATARRPTVSSPNPPSSRRSTISDEPLSPAPGPQRTSSVRSSRNNPRSVSNESSSSMAPPPPPPRRRQSGRSSLDQQRPAFSQLPPSPTEKRRSSTEHKRTSIDGKRRTSIASESSLKYEYSPAPDNETALYSPKEESEEPTTYTLDTAQSTNSNNTILDDMEKFQKEIEELREKYNQAA